MTSGLNECAARSVPLDQPSWDVFDIREMAGCEHHIFQAQQFWRGLLRGVHVQQTPNLQAVLYLDPVKTCPRRPP